MTNKQIFHFWTPLAFTWLMMASEGPLVVALVARLADPKPNLAAHGVALGIAILVEAPVIMIMSAATALVRDRESYFKLRNFIYTLNVLITLVMFILLVTPGMDWITIELMEINPQTARLIHGALLILLPWPAAIGYRRFFDGILIRAGLTRRVTYGTFIRLGSMALTSLALYHWTGLPGAYVGAAGLSVGVILEAIATGFMARATMVGLLAKDVKPRGKRLTYGGICRFYYPLALTATIALAMHPMIAFFVGRARLPLESLAVIPVVTSFVFLFRALGLSFQEVVIALAGENGEQLGQLKRFAFGLGLAVAIAMGLTVFTPLARLWFEHISGLQVELALFAELPIKILALIPSLSVLISFQRGFLVRFNHTPPVTWASIIEVGVVALILFVGIYYLDLTGVMAMAIAILLGRLASNSYLFAECRKVNLTDE